MAIDPPGRRVVDFSEAMRPKTALLLREQLQRRCGGCELRHRFYYCLLIPGSLRNFRCVAPTYFDVLLQPKVAFRAAGHSKRLWLAIEIVGFLLSYTGMITWPVYSIWIRLSVVRAGGRPLKKGALFAGFFGALAESSAPSF